MGCGSSGTPPANTLETKENGLNEKTEKDTQQSYPPPEAFEVPLETNSDESLVKKHPPKRILQRLAEIPAANSQTTIQDLEEKLANAEIRRQKFLQQRVEMLKSKDMDENLNEQENDETITDPPTDCNEIDNTEESVANETPTNTAV